MTRGQPRSLQVLPVSRLVWMIEAIAVKLFFAPLSLYELYLTNAPRPFCMLELSVIAWGVCFIIGWWFTCQRVEKLYIAEGLVANADADQEEQNKANCYRDKTKMQSIAWMLEVDGIGKFFFKALYWFSYAFIHSLFMFLVLAAIVYTYMIFNHSETGTEWCRETEFANPCTWIENTIVCPEKAQTITGTLKIPALFGMKGIFIFFNERFVLMHVAVFVVSFLTFYLCCSIFLKEEGPNADKKTIMVNRQRFKYLLYISYIFVDTCYMVFEFIMMLHVNTPQALETAMDNYKKTKVIEGFNSLKDLKAPTPPGNTGFDYYAFKAWILSQDINTDSKVKLISIVQQLLDRDAFCKDLLERQQYEKS